MSASDDVNNDKSTSGTDVKLINNQFSSMLLNAPNLTQPQDIYANKQCHFYEVPKINFYFPDQNDILPSCGIEGEAEIDVQNFFNNWMPSLLEKAKLNSGVHFRDQSTSKGQPWTIARADCVFYSSNYIKSLKENEVPDPCQALFIIEVKNKSENLGDNDVDLLAQIVQRGEETLNTAPWRGSVVFTD